MLAILILFSVVIVLFPVLVLMLLPRLQQQVLSSLASTVEKMMEAQAAAVKSALGIDSAAENPYSEYNQTVQFYPDEENTQVETPPWEMNLDDPTDLDDGWIRPETSSG